MLTIGTPLQTSTKPMLLQRRPEPPDVTVTYDPKGDCYDYNAPGYHHQVSRLSPWSEGATTGLVIGVPSLVGAAETALVGVGASSLVSLMLSPTAGAVLGGVIAGRMAWEGTNKNPIFTGLAALVGVGVGTIAWPVLKLPGVLGGLKGALAAAGVAFGGAAARAIVWNHREDALARSHGCQRP
jgi:hypothetical protein